MRHLTTIALLVSVTATTAAQDRGNPSGAVMPSVTLPPALERVLRDYERAWQQRDAVALAALFTSDGFVLSPGRAPVRGRVAIEERYRESGGALALRALAFATADSVGYIIGAFAGQEGAVDIGKFVLTLRTDRTGRWLIAADMDSGNSR